MPYPVFDMCERQAYSIYAYTRVSQFKISQITIGEHEC